MKKKEVNFTWNDTIQKLAKLRKPDVSVAKRKVCSMGLNYEKCCEHPLNELGCLTCEKYVEQT